MNDGKPPIAMKVIKPDINPPQAPLARIAWELDPISWKIEPTQMDTAIKTMILSQ